MLSDDVISRSQRVVRTDCRLNFKRRHNEIQKNGTEKTEKATKRQGILAMYVHTYMKLLIEKNLIERI